MPRRAPLPLLLALALAFALVGAGGASAAAPDALNRLDAPSWSEREAASTELMVATDLSEEELADLVPPPGERPEARARLLAVLQHHVLRRLREELEPRPQRAENADAGGLLERAGRAALRGPVPGSLGISHRAFPAGSVPGLDTPSIAVLRTLPGFPGHAVLRVGDLITSLNGRPVPWPEAAAGNLRAGAEQQRRRLAGEASQGAAAFRSAIQAAGAGTRVTLGVWRDGRTLEIPVTLARSDALQRLYPGGGNAEPTALLWRDRLAELLPDEDR